MNVFKKMALAAALVLFSLISQGNASADDRHEGYVNVDGTSCHMGPADDYAVYGDPLWYGMPISILITDAGNGWTMIDPTGNGESCLVPLGSVTEGSLQPATGGTLEVIGSNVVNSDGVNCRDVPGGDVVTSFNTGDVVTELADGVDDGWQAIALEARLCYIDADYLGVNTPEPVEDVSYTETIPAQTDVAPVVVQPVVPQVTGLPSTGSGVYAIDLGVDGRGTKPELTNAQESAAWLLPAALVIIVVAVVAIRRHDIRQERHTNHVESFRR